MGVNFLLVGECFDVPVFYAVVTEGVVMVNVSAQLLSRGSRRR